MLFAFFARVPHFHTAGPASNAMKGGGGTLGWCIKIIPRSLTKSMLENNALWLLLRSQFYLSGSVIFKIPHTYGMDASGVFLSPQACRWRFEVPSSPFPLFHTSTAYDSYRLISCFPTAIFIASFCSPWQLHSTDNAVMMKRDKWGGGTNGNETATPFPRPFLYPLVTHHLIVNTG